MPGVLALMPEYAGQVDPVTDLRAACLAAVAWLGEGGGVQVVGSGTQAERVGAHLLGEVGGVRGAGRNHLVVGNGSACRTEKAPGHLDERAAGFDAALGDALRTRDTAALASLDPELATRLWTDAAAFHSLAGLLTGAGPATVDYEDDPFGVQYWVMRWTCGS